MAEEKTFRYGFIMLGFFLVMTGMFIMSVEKPQIYATFCAGGILLIAVGVTWSMCQCYPRVGREGWGLCPGVWGSWGFRELWGRIWEAHSGIFKVWEPGEAPSTAVTHQSPWQRAQRGSSVPPVPVALAQRAFFQADFFSGRQQPLDNAFLPPR